MLTIFRLSTGRHELLDGKTFRISRIQSDINFFVSKILIYYFRSQTFEVCHVCKVGISYPSIVISSYIVLTKTRTWFLCLYFGSVTSLLRHYATSRRISGSILGGVAGDFFRGSDRTMCPGVDSASKN